MIKQNKNKKMLPLNRKVASLLRKRMSQQNVCHFNKFGFCKFRNKCYRYHENEVCENVSCKVFDCNLRHPSKCSYYSKYFYCKFGSFCKFSHRKKEDQDKKSVELLEKELDGVKKLIDEKENELKRINQEIKNSENKIKSEIEFISRRNECIEKELEVIKAENKRFESCSNTMKAEIVALKSITTEKNEALKAELNNIKEETEIMNSKYNALEKEIDCLKSQIKSKEHADEIVVEYEAEAADPESKSCHTCEKCGFLAKSEAGLKTHDTVKHKKSIFKAYSKVSR